MYDNGHGVKQDYAKAAKWYRKAAEQGDAAAQFNLAIMYAFGHGVMESGAAAADWYYKAGLSYLNENDRDRALRSVERIKDLQAVLHLSVPNAFLANKLLNRIYGGSETEQSSPKVKQKKASSVVSGTGWPVAGGYVVTNHHVIAGRKTIFLYRTDGVKISASVAVDDVTNDLALLKPDNGKLLPPALPLANRAAQVGGHVFTVGYPHPDMMGKEPKLTDGIVNARTGLKNDPRVYQISVPLQGGNSGGPLINMRGEVVGVTTSKMSAIKVFKWTGDLPQNVNYAVKVGYVRALLSSVDSASSVPVLPVRKSDLATLAKRIEGSVLMVIAQ
jgi:S1-C subfamily serine protease